MGQAMAPSFSTLKYEGAPEGGCPGGRAPGSKCRMMDEGYIKFSLEALDGDPPSLTGKLSALNEIRSRLFQMNLIGVLDNGIGYGNLSIRSDGETELFIISGSATGGVAELTAQEYCAVVKVDIAKNSLVCKGKINASSESMSHAAVYDANSQIQCVIHVHNTALFEYMLKLEYPSTSENSAYGTPEMAFDLRALVAALDEPRGVIVMAGHQDGVFSYGEDIQSAMQELMRVMDKMRMDSR